MLKNFISWFITFCSISFFQLKGLGKGDRIFDILGIAIIGFMLLLYVTYQGQSAIKANFKYPILLLFFAVFASVLMANKFNNQAAFLTIYEQRGIYFFLFYFLLLYLVPEPKNLEKMILVFTLIYCTLYIVQKVIYPILITDAMLVIDRGTLRIYMPGASIMVFGYFIAYKNIFEKFNWLPLIVMALTLSVVFLMAGRQVLISLVIISFFSLLINKKIKNRFIIIGLFIIGISLIGLAMGDILNDMLTVTVKHSQEGTNYIRFKAAKYFIYDFHQNIYTIIFGNGEPTERSSYGHSLAEIAKYYGFYLSDLGIIGAYIKFGVIFVITVIFVLLKILFSKKDSRISFIKNYFLFIVITMFTTGFAFIEKEGIVILCIAFYLFDYYKNKPFINNSA